MNRASQAQRLPDWTDPDSTYTIRQFLEEQHYPKIGMQSAVFRFGRVMLDTYRMVHKRDPYSIREGSEGAKRVYLSTDLPLIHETYRCWLDKERRKEGRA